MKCHGIDGDGARCQADADLHPVMVSGVPYPLCDAHWESPPATFVAARAPSKKLRRRAPIDPLLARDWRTTPRPRARAAEQLCLGIVA